MSRLAFFLTALWLSSAAAHPGIGDYVSSSIKTVVNVVGNEMQTLGHPVEQSIAYIGGKLCPSVKTIFGVNYQNYEGAEPDMSQLTLDYITKSKTVHYKLEEAAKEIPKERWWNRKLLIYLHGFTDNPAKSSFQTMRAAFKSKDDETDILVLDASSLIGSFYLRAATLVEFIGNFLGNFIVALLPAGLELSNVHLLGHSLGSHIAGSAGKTVKTLTGSQVARISGLDPAGPCFSTLDESLRLSKDDAEFVNVIHTNAGVYGLNEQVGHVDFWPNGGSVQPGCVYPTCSHSRAWELFAESVLYPERVLAVKCDSYDNFKQGEFNMSDTSIMGYATPSTTRGNYYLQTSNEEPYAAGDEGLTYKPNGILRKAQDWATDFLRGR